MTKLTYDDFLEALKLAREIKDRYPSPPICIDPVHYALNDAMEKGQAVMIHRGVFINHPGCVVMHPDDLPAWRDKFDMVPIQEYTPNLAIDEAINLSKREQS